MPESSGICMPIVRIDHIAGAERSEAAEARRAEREEGPRREFRTALSEAEAATPLVEPTAEEARNGWTAESLSSYLQDQQASASQRVDPASAMRRQGRRPPRDRKSVV